ncbi:MAG: PorP/SprF family type IX secretion system membrane protein [Cytophagales bacterium]|nr:PorP/SprF family type IX secretion system membrane protein [Cytophagales bacterium]
MKRIGGFVFAIALLLYFSIESKAQQKEYYFSQYQLSPQLINPAFTGINQSWNALVGFRTVNAEVEGKPKNYFFGFNGNFMQQATSNEEGAEESAKSMPSHGIGGFVYNREASGFDHVVWGASYSYYRPISSSFALSGGVGFYADYQHLDMDQFYARDPNDPRYLDLLRKNGKSTTYNITGGVGIYGHNYFLGYMYNQDLGESITGSQPIDVFISFHGHQVSAGYKLEINPLWSVLSSAHYRLLTDDDDSFIGALRFAYQDLFDFGAVYKYDEAIGFNVSFLVKKHLQLAYSFDLAISGEHNINKGSHEVVLGYRFWSEKRKLNFW